MSLQHAQARIKNIQINEEKRIITGIASTPSPDRDNDSVNPSGVKYALPIPLLWQHDHNQPIGEVIAVEQRDGQLHITAQIKKIQEVGSLQARIDEAWQNIKNGLVKGLSIGFKGIKYHFNTNGGINFDEWEWLELSAVTIPCNREAMIQSVKHAADKQHSEPPTRQPGNQTAPKQAVNFLSTKRATAQKEQSKMNLNEQIQATRKALAQKQAAIIAKEAEKLADDADVVAIENEVSSLEQEAQAFEKNIERLGKIQKMQSEIHTKASEVPSTPAIVQSRNLGHLEKGVPFAQFVRTKMLCQHEMRKNGNIITTADAARQLNYSDEVVDFVSKAVLGTTAETGFAKPLTDTSVFTGDFLELLRNKTIFDQLQGYRNVPFNVKINGQLSGSSASWVGEGKAKPLTNPTFNQVEIKEHKLAAIVVYTQELLRRADPAIDILVRDDLIQACAQLVDKTFLDDQAASDTRPAGILNGATKVTSTGTTAAQIEADLFSLISEFTKANLSTDNSYFIMSETRAMQFALLRDALGNTYFNGMNFAGTRSILGIPVITSQAVGDKVILLKTSELLVAQDGGVDVSYSDQATLIDGHEEHNLWQENKFAIRVEKFITWAKRRVVAAAYIAY